jgi:hypothetical protein
MSPYSLPYSLTRIVVGSSLIEYLNAQPHKPEHDRIGRVNHGIAQLCLNLFSMDDDGCVILDYLGAALTALGRKTNGKAWDEIRQLAFSFVISERERFEQEHPEGCLNRVGRRLFGRDRRHKLVRRYERLAAYCHSRGFGAA